MIALILCAHGRVSLDWSVHFANMLKYTSVPVEVLISRHYNIDKARQNGVMVARKIGATHCLFVDSDIIPLTYQNNVFAPFPQVINYMLSFHYPIVSGLYLSKKDMWPVVYDYVGEDVLFKITDKKFEDFVDKISFADGVGLGFCLIDMRVFDILERNGYFPFFEYKTDYEKRIEISEDLYFCNLLRKCGFSIMVLGKICCMHIATMGLLPNRMVEYLPTSE